MNYKLSSPQSYNTFIEAELHPYVLESSRKGESGVIALVGDLGAGKSTLTRKLCSYLGIVEKIPSPTFLLMKEYSIDPVMWGKSRLVHVDAYRIQDTAELAKLGFLDVLNNKEVLAIVEWADKTEEIVPNWAAWYLMSATGAEERIVERTR